MASFTKHFGLGYFDFGNPLGTDFAGQIEIDRFVTIDKILFGLMSIFGNGVVQGWQVSISEALTLSINEGFGNINFMSGRTNFPATISELSPNSIFYVYAKTKIKTTFTENVEFFIDTSSTLAETDFKFLLLAKVTTGNTSIESIDNSVRREIGFIELIKATIRLHKHRGGSLNPSKIDLTEEVKGQLPSFRIADFDAEKITTGTFDLSRMPLLDHQDLKNVGLLTHPQLDTFVKTLESSNTELFGEIGTSNLLQLIIAAKLIYEDPESILFSGAKIDENMINEFVVIPGITTDDYIDFDNTTAKVDLEQHFVQGIPPVTGTSFFVNIDTALAWQSSHLLDNIIVSGDSVTLSFDDIQESTTEVIEGFESATDPNQSLTQINLLDKETVILIDNADILAETSSTNTTEGFYSGEFSHRQAFRSQFVKNFDTPQDWSTFDSFIFDVKCLSSVHGSVKMFFKDSSGDITPDFTVLDANEVTDNFEMRVIDLTTIPFRNDIKSFTIYSDDLTNVFTYFVDNIHIQRALLLPEEGTIKIRYSAGAPVTFASIEWLSTEPPGTEISVRARSANGSVFLNRANYTGVLNSGDITDLVGTDLEIEITLLPDSNRLLAPILHSLKFLILTDAEIDGFSINTQTEFNRGFGKNISVGSGVSLDTPVFVESFYFALNDNVHQIHEKSDTSGNLFIDSDENGIQVTGIQDTPISPNLVFRSVEKNGANAAVRSGSLFEPRSVIRQTGRSVVIADTYNDRVIELDESGSLLSGIGSINYEADTTFPIAACVDIRTGILYVVWSKKVSFKTVNVSKITLQSSTNKVHLIKDFDKILGLTTDELQTSEAEGQIMPVFLSAQNSGLAQLLPAVESFMQVDGDPDNGVILGGINVQSVFYKSATGGSTLGIHCFIGNFAYVDGIFSPTHANKTSSEGFIVSNGTIAIKDYSFPQGISESISKNSNISSIVEFDKNNNIVFASDILQFSPFFPGRVKELDSSTLLIGGIKPGGVSGTPESPLEFRSIFGNNDSKNQQKAILDSIFFGGETPYIGSVIVYDKRLNTAIFQYISPEGVLVSDVGLDSHGQYVIAESSFARSGRIIKVDNIGNVIFSTGDGVYSIINSINIQFDDSIVVST